MNTFQNRRFGKWDLLIVAALVVLALALRVPAAWLKAAPEDMKSLYVAGEGLPYLADMDSYYYYRLTEQLVETGEIGEDGVDSLRGVGGSLADTPPLLIYTAAFAYRVAGGVFGVPLYAVAYWLCAALGALIVIPAYLFVWRLSGRLGGAVAAVLVSLNARFLSQTSPGMLDTDGYNVLLPLMIVLFLSCAIRARKPLAAAVYTALAVAAYGLFTLNWIFAIYMLVIVGVFSLLYCPLALCLRAADPGGARRRLCGLLPPLAALAAMTVISWPRLVSSVNSLLGMIRNSAAPLTEGAFPNFTIAVSEMQKGLFLSGNPFLASENSIINGLGGVQCAALALAGLIWLAVRASRCRESGVWERRGLLADLLMMLLLLTGYTVATYAGYRFVMLLALPVGLLAGMGAGWLAGALGRRVRRRGFAGALQGAVCAVLCASTVLGAWQSGVSRLPQANALMDDAMAYLRENTPEDAVILSWWDNGYFYEHAARRRTLLDGGRQGNVHLYYMSCALTTPDEQLAAGILKMMAASDTAAHTLFSQETGSHKEAARILLSILPLTREEAVARLTEAEGWTPERAAAATALSHPQAEAPLYFVFSSDMLSKAGWYFFFAGWDFERKGGDSTAAATHVAKTTAQLAAGQKNEFLLGAAADGGSMYAVVTVAADGQVSVALESRSEGGGAACSSLLSRVILTDGQGMLAELATGGDAYTLALLMDGSLVRPALLRNEMADCWYMRRLLGDGGGGRFTKVYETAAGGSLVNRLMTLDTTLTQAGAFTIWEVR